MVTAAAGLDEAQLQAIAALESRVVAADGGRLKLEWGALRDRPPGEVRDFLLWDKGASSGAGASTARTAELQAGASTARAAELQAGAAGAEAKTLVGFAGLYAFGFGTIEIAGMVDPAARRAGHGNALLSAALQQCRLLGKERALLVVPRNAAGGGQFAAARGGVLEHSEHVMVLAGEPAPGPSDPDLSLRLATADDVPTFAAILSEAFGGPAPSSEATVFETAHSRRLVVERGGVVVGTINLVWDGDDGRVYAFAIDARLRGQGIGRDVLRRACNELRARGAKQVGLEVLTDNDHALGLYRSLGFQRLSTEDYYELTLK